MIYWISGGTGSLGTHLTKKLLGMSDTEKIIIFSRDEYKQRHMMDDIKDKRVVYEVGDVRDRSRVSECMYTHEPNYVIHAAALKHVPVGEEKPTETVKTNIFGTMNVIDACKKNKVKKAILISTDKGCHPVNLYGATKMVGEKLFIAANQNSKTLFACVRYGNVIGSRGSVIETILVKKPKTLTITNGKMTRFWLTLDMAVNLVLLAIEKAKPGEIFVPKARAMSVVKMFKALAPDTELVVTGMRPGEKLHESMINRDESIHTKEFKDHFVIEPELFGVEYSDLAWEYTSENCLQLTEEEFLKMVYE